MTTIKAYTDLEQSRKLAEILPLESADMFYMFESINGEPHYHPIIITEHTNRNFIISEHNSGKGVVAWSLAALLGVLPNPKLHQAIGGHWLCECWKNSKDVKSNESTYIGCTKADNPIDACYEMILKLHELNLL